MDNFLIVFEYLRCFTIVFNIAFIIILSYMIYTKKEYRLGEFARSGIKDKNNPYTKIVYCTVKYGPLKEEYFKKYKKMHMAILGILSSVFAINVYIVYLVIKDLNDDL